MGGWVGLRAGLDAVAKVTILTELHVTNEVSVINMATFES